MLNSQLVQTNLNTQTLGRNIEYYPVLGSTNTEARNIIKKGAPYGTVVITDHQTAGRGQRGKNWESKVGLGLTFSIILYPELPTDRIGLFPLLSAIALGSVFTEYGIETRFKWPNDILIKSHKIAGILCESQMRMESVEALIIGIGLNVNEQHSDFSENLRNQVTSMYLESGRIHQKEEVLADVLNGIEVWLHTLIENGPGPIQTAWVERCGHHNQRVTLLSGGRTITGLFTGISAEGAAKIQTPEGLISVSSGELIHPIPV